MPGPLKTSEKKAETHRPVKRRKDRWREPRILFDAGIEVTGIDVRGHPFRERSKTRDVSEWGCGFYSSARLERHALVAIRVLGNPAHCFPEVQPVMFMVSHTRQEGDVWVTGASKIQPERLWNVESLLAGMPHQVSPPVQTSKQHKQNRSAGASQEKTLDSLPFGAIQLDTTGKILQHNRYGSSSARDTEDKVTGLNFFTDVVPRGAVKEFYQRFENAIRARKTCETFELPYRTGERLHHLLITMFYSAGTHTVWVLVHPVPMEK